MLPQPPFLRGMSPCVFFVLPHMKKFVKDRHFDYVEVIKETKLKEQVANIDKEARKNNQVIYGIDIDRDNLNSKVLQVISEATDTDFPENKISDIYQLDKKEKCPILVKLQNQTVKQLIPRGAQKLKGTGISLAADLTEEERNQRRELVTRMKQARIRGVSACIEGNSLIINNKTSAKTQKAKREKEPIKGGKQEATKNSVNKSGRTKVITRSATV
ncbi:hypothetical protein HHI36_007593 [Cryptolaemus montrouzieri]|uniref:Uncharacterized protein n=1 Tax=Cryptolaemus montrouzieri TaxID=559131 RepID=A0ABD2MQA6_9CUCU